MENFLFITALNDFIFCPYSIYLHEILLSTKPETYHDLEQFRGKRLHHFIEKDQNEISWKNAFVYSKKLKIYGKIDDYIPENEELIEYKSATTIIYRGYYYQIWSQYFCLSEMGFSVKSLAFYDLKKMEKCPIPLPSSENFKELQTHIKKVKEFDFTTDILVNPNKCLRCIYSQLCEKSPL